VEKRVYLEWMNDGKVKEYMPRVFSSDYMRNDDVSMYMILSAIGLQVAGDNTAALSMLKDGIAMGKWDEDQLQDWILRNLSALLKNTIYDAHYEVVANAIENMDDRYGANKDLRPRF
jgi:hypothetical protein